MGQSQNRILQVGVKILFELRLVEKKRKNEKEKE